MFNLEAAIADWRRSLAKTSIDGLSMDELESHLRDSIDQLKQLGLGADECFIIATRRLGHPDHLHAEFSKERSPVELSKFEFLAKWQAVHGQLLRDDALYRKRHTSFLISITCLSIPLLVVYGYYFGIGIPGFAANVSITFCSAAAIIWLALRQFNFMNHHIRTYLQSERETGT